MRTEEVGKGFRRMEWNYCDPDKWGGTNKSASDHVDVWKFTVTTMFLQKLPSPYLPRSLSHLSLHASILVEVYGSSSS